MTIKDELAGLSGAALGHIIGGPSGIRYKGFVPGAISGYKLGKFLSQNSRTKSTTMAPTQKGKQYGPKNFIGPRFKGGRITKSKMSIAPVPKKKPMRSTVRRTVSAQSASVVKHKKVKDTLKDRKRKRVTVSKSLRAKITKVISQKEVTGYARHYGLGGLYIPNPSNVNLNKILPTEQFVFPLPNGCSFERTGSPAVPLVSTRNLSVGKALSSIQMQYLVARLFNGAPLQLDPSLINLNDTAGLFAFPTTGTPSKILKFDVLQSKAIIQMKNCTKQTWYIEMYVCKPKVQRAVNTEFSASFVSRMSLPLEDWASGLQQDLGNGTTDMNTAMIAPVGVTKGANVSGVQLTNLGQSPEQNQQFKNNWAYEKFSIVLEPGQKHIHTINGETGTFDLKNMYKNIIGQTPTPSSSYILQSKWDREVFFVMKTDLQVSQNGANPGLGGRFDITEFETTRDHGLAFELQSIYKFSMPEPTGYRTGNATGTATVQAPDTQLLNTYRRAAYVNDYYCFRPEMVGGSNIIRTTARTDDNVPDASFN